MLIYYDVWLDLQGQHRSFRLLSIHKQEWVSQLASCLDANSLHMTYLDELVSSSMADEAELCFDFLASSDSEHGPWHGSWDARS